MTRWDRSRFAVAAPLLAAIAFAAGCHTRPAATATAVFLVRHAEKVADMPDPPLSDEGRARARALAHALSDAGIDVIYSTEFARTRQTAQAVSEVTGLDVRIFPVGESTVDAFIDGLAREILERQAGRTVLVVGHSNTVPALARALGATEAADLTEKDYDDLFLVELTQTGAVRLLRLHYGERSP